MSEILSHPLIWLLAFVALLWTIEDIATSYINRNRPQCDCMCHDEEDEDEVEEDDED